MGVCDDFLDVSVTSFRVLPLNAVSQSGWHALNVALKVSGLLMKEGLTISKKKLDVSHLGHINGRVIDLGDDTVPDSKPNPTGSRVGCADPVLVAVRPARLQTRPAKRVTISSNSCHLQIPCLTPLKLANLVGRHGQKQQVLPPASPEQHRSLVALEHLRRTAFDSLALGWPASALVWETLL